MNAKVQHCNAIRNTMVKNSNKSGDSVSPLDTLAVLETKANPDDISLSNTTTSSDRKVLLKRARRKYFSTGLAIKLVSASEQNKASRLRQAYWNTYHCNSVLVLRKSGKLTGTYCKNRWCMVCNAIRTAKSMIDYIPIIKSWDDAHMVTLTVPNCSANDLEKTIKDLQDCFVRICKTVYKQYSRKKCDYKLIGIRKFECTYNSHTNTYHPHYHVIFKEERMGQRMYDEWLSRNTTCSSKAQDIRKADLNSLQELFKYMTKVISNTGKERVIYADAMDVIFNEMRNKNVLQNFGFRKPKGKDPFKQEPDNTVITAVYLWQQSYHDWMNTEEGDMLTNFTPVEMFKELIHKKILVRPGFQNT